MPRNGDSFFDWGLETRKFKLCSALEIPRTVRKVSYNFRNTNNGYSQQPYTQIGPFLFQGQKRVQKSGTGAKRGSSLYPGDHSPREIILWSLRLYMRKLMVTEMSPPDQDQRRSIF